jgi:NADPH:quinone reductase-like Zn-dependent oxidoreductase
VDVYYDMVCHPLHLLGTAPDHSSRWAPLLQVGGATLDTVLPMLNVGARVVVVGTAATAAWLPPPLGPRVERTILVKRAALHGFLVFDYAAEFPEAWEVRSRSRDFVVGPNHRTLPHAAVCIANDNTGAWFDPRLLLHAQLLGRMVADGSLAYTEEVRQGLEAAPQALEDLYTGANTGKVVIQVEP